MITARFGDVSLDISEPLWSKNLPNFNSIAHFEYFMRIFFRSVASFGQTEKILEKFSGCSLERCSPIGLDNIDFPARGAFSVATHAGSPYCRKYPQYC